MKNEFVSFEQAKALKEFGFNEECFGYYNIQSEKLRVDYRSKGIVGDVNMVEDVDILVLAPTWNQAFKFFRDRGIHVFITNYKQEDGVVFWYFSQRNGGLQGSDSLYGYKSFEEAQSAALDHLINYDRNKN